MVRGAAFLAAGERLVDGGADGVRRFRRRQDALGARELEGRLEDRQLRVRLGLDLPELSRWLSSGDAPW